MADEPEPTHGANTEGATPAVDIRVTRTGGVAGVRRGWSVESPDPAPWRPLVEACPWDDEPDGALTGVDRFAWRIEVLAPEPPRNAELPERALHGPWRELVERVRDEGAPVRPAPRGASDG
ncbi:MAG: hypothetical protein J0H23_15440 [Micrococcales bacterium]|nr:hypothetical protein [Micrococcales bacterium]OJX68749.1 MAG: hypothetical protein BGO94_08990 [Micrococcales bacterium 72-143]